MAPVPAESPATKVGKWLLAAVIPLSALALGAVPAEVLVAVTGVASIACSLLWLQRDVPISRPSRWVLIAIAILLCMTVLQAVPLPSSLSRVLAPANADIWARALSPLHESGPAIHPLSIAPPATHVEIVRGFFYACVFLGALRVTTLEHGERFLIRVVVFSAVVMALSALAHTAVSAEKVFGIYRPREIYAYAPGHYAPLLNTNHLAAYLNVGACVALGALLSRRSMPRALSGAAVLVLVAMSLWQGSRGATGSLLFAIVLAFGLTIYAKRRLESARAGGLILVACAIAATLIVTVTYSEASSHLLSAESMKGEVARRSLALVGGSPWFGSGRGGFETVFASVRPSGDYVTWTNPEDIVVQWLVEWGVPASLAGFGLLGWALRPQLVLRAVRPAVGAWVAIVGTFVHDLVDYHLEIPGVVALVAVCGALVVSGRPTSRDPGRTAPAASARVAAFAVALGGAIAIAIAWRDLGHSLPETRRALSAEAVDTSVSSDEFRANVRAAMLRYPAEPFVPLMGAVRAQAVDSASVVPWVGRALERNPHFGRAHFVLARSLVPRYMAQARLEYRLAYEYDSGLRAAIVKEAVPIIDGPTAALELVPDDDSGIAILEQLVVALAPRMPATAAILDAELERRQPTSLAPLRRRVEAAVADATSDAPWCVGRPLCVADALAAARDLSARDPAKCAGYILEARVRVKRGEAAAALDALDADIQKVSDRAPCLQQFIALATESGQVRRADAALDQLLRSGCGEDAECLDLYGWAASREEQRGHYARAARLYRRILEIKPEREDLLERIGELGDKDGMLTDALDAYRTLSLIHPSEPRYLARSAELRARVQRAPAPPVPRE